MEFLVPCYFPVLEEENTYMESRTTTLIFFETSSAKCLLVAFFVTVKLVRSVALRSSTVTRVLLVYSDLNPERPASHELLERSGVLDRYDLARTDLET